MFFTVCREAYFRKYVTPQALSQTSGWSASSWPRSCKCMDSKESSPAWASITHVDQTPKRNSPKAADFRPRFRRQPFSWLAANSLERSSMFDDVRNTTHGCLCTYIHGNTFRQTGSYCWLSQATRPTPTRMQAHGQRNPDLLLYDDNQTVCWVLLWHWHYYRYAMTLTWLQIMLKKIHKKQDLTSCLFFLISAPVLVGRPSSNIITATASNSSSNL